ncbi:zinc-dependent metalloprotease [Chryseobacterium taklimakanense]|uniref:zinc-dependent metalloprotease n=1 Tax=Chryseobacterium taklimakanense TaxID=536441 RepID=UPI0023F95F0F|nr:zinc-dependent metalloprotease [Chryseobacterium taklimakanense]
MNQIKYFLLISFFPFCFSAQERDDTKDSLKIKIEKIVIRETKVVKDSTKAKKEENYSSLVKGAVTKRGLFTIHKVKDDVYFEIPNSLFGKDLLIVNKISAVPSQINEAGINKGMNYENKLIRFYRDTANKKVRVKTFDPKISVPNQDNIYASVKDNFVESIIESFDIKTYGPDSTAVIKVNNVFDGNSKSFNNVFDNIGMGSSIRTKDSYIDEIKAFPENVVVKSLLTTQISEGKTSAEKADLTVQTTTNIVLLPEPMVGRYSDSRVGYFTVKKQYYSDAQQEVKQKELITRWRLEPKDEDRERYLRGELVDPKKPIVYYIDPATPKQWQQAIIDGVYDWNKAFEQAGFKNVISAKLPDPTDKNFDPDDVRYSVITYAASAMANAMGPSVVDPRTGEILESDIIWWHNVMSLLQSWMRVQTAIIDPSVRANQFSDTKMAHAIRFVSSHEVGHTFGLKHNMGSSFAYDVDSLRSKEFTSKMGGTSPSIMDYARFNYVAQEGDGVTQITPEIGTYDKFAIEWGYRWTGKSTPDDEITITRKWIEPHAKDPLYFYGEQQEEVIDPRSQAEDLGNDAMKAGEYGITNLKKTIPKIIEWTTQSGEDYDNAKSLYNQLINQWYIYNNHVLANIGGIYINPTVKGDGLRTYTSVPYDIQKSALDFLIRNIITLPEWLFVNDLSSLIKPAKSTPMGLVDQSVYNVFREKQAAVLYGLMNDKKILRLLDNEFTQERAKTGVKMMTPVAMFDILREAVFKNSIKARSLSISERMTQKNYIDALIIDVNNLYEKTEKNFLHLPMICDYALETHHHELDDKNLTLYFEGMKRLSEVGSVKRAELIKVKKIIAKVQASGNQETRDHYADMLMRLNRALREN